MSVRTVHVGAVHVDVLLLCAVGVLITLGVRTNGTGERGTKRNVNDEQSWNAMGCRSTDVNAVS